MAKLKKRNLKKIKDQIDKDKESKKKSKDKTKAKSKTKKTTSISSKKKPVYPEIFAEKGYIYKANDDGSKIKKGKEIVLEDIEKSIDSDQVNLKLSFLYGGEKQIKSLSRENLANRNQLVKELSLSGSDAYQHNATAIIKHICNQEEKYPIQDIAKVHHYLGWDEVDKELIFKHQEALGINSDYIGNLDIESSGSYKKFKKLIEEEVLGHTPLELALSLGLSSAIVGLIGNKMGLNNLVVHIYGDSTEGKTTAAQLAASCWGNPDPSVKGLVKDWNATYNALFGLLENNQGLTVVFDESSMSNMNDLSNMIYKFASGRDKDRMNRNAELKETNTWSTTIISTGEHALTTKTNQNIGILMRILELGSINWTKDADSADRIKQTVLNNYGYLGKMFARHLKKAGIKAVMSIFDKEKDKCYEMLTKTKFAKRIASKIALVMTTARLANNFLNLNLNIEEIRDFLIKAEDQKITEQDLGEKAYESFIEQVTTNKAKFILDFGNELGKPSKKQNQNTWGQIDYDDQGCVKEITILPDAFNKLMIKSGFEEPEIILKKWREEGLLDHEKDRLSRRRKINDLRQKVYVIKVEDY